MTPVFSSWRWAVVVGSWMAFGSLFRHPDARLYQDEESPLEELLVESPADTPAD